MKCQKYFHTLLTVTIIHDILYSTPGTKERKVSTMKNLTMKNSIIRTSTDNYSLTGNYYTLSSLILNPVTFIRFIVDIIRKH